jgi:CubicO group peptidase (beta-lactamase class C family)
LVPQSSWQPAIKIGPTSRPAAAGLADYLCHRAAHIEATSGYKESLLHLLQFAEVGVPILAAGGIYGTQFWVDPTNRVVGVVMTQTAIIGSGPIANAVRETFYAAE